MSQVTKELKGHQLARSYEGLAKSLDVAINSLMLVRNQLAELETDLSGVRNYADQVARLKGELEETK